MGKEALVVIDLQNDITKNYKTVIINVNHSIDWAVEHDVPVVYIRHENLSAGTRTFKTGTAGPSSSRT
ncbi:isochorismatase family protein [Exiguobacterium sp. AB2]|uniref:isochorismatase family protein n=1 Tax=Exiguobacterium sp. AB2 TaxID=1484479 RepID=UPI000AF73B1E|nr:isochorismatase family protein [Exiguobacterium sp. AB2]